MEGGVLAAVGECPRQVRDGPHPLVLPPALSQPARPYPRQHPPCLSGARGRIGASHREYGGGGLLEEA
eukprot:6086340-Alexandrium_andersonii.AAC.1